MKTGIMNKIKSTAIKASLFIALAASRVSAAPVNWSEANAMVTGAMGVLGAFFDGIVLIAPKFFQAAIVLGMLGIVLYSAKKFADNLTFKI